MVFLAMPREREKEKIRKRRRKETGERKKLRAFKPA